MSFLRQGHGNGVGQPRIEVTPPDELAGPVPAEPDRVARRQNGTVATSDAAKALGAKGGAKKAQRARLIAGMGLQRLPSDAPFAPYQKAGEDFLQAHLADLATVAGGRVGAAPSSMVASAAMQLAASRYLFDVGARTGDGALLKQASGLANDSRQNLLAAYELAVREAQARDPEADDLAASQLLFQRRLAAK